MALAGMTGGKTGLVGFAPLSQASSGCSSSITKKLDECYSLFHHFSCIMTNNFSLRAVRTPVETAEVDAPPVVSL